MGDRELRCQGNIFHGLIVDGDAKGTLEIRCRSKFCGKSPETIVLHRFDLSDGSYVTKVYKEPRRSINGCT